MSSVRILLADDHTLVRAGIRALLQEIDGATIVAEAENGRDAVQLARQHQPDVAILDISMPELNGIEATARMKSEGLRARVLVLSMHTSEDFVGRALRAGADGYMVKDCAPLELRLAIEALLRGESYLSPRISRLLVDGFVQAGNAAPSSLDALTARQREILQMIAEGRSTKEIAFALDVSVKTIESHRASLMERLGIRDLAGLVLFAVRNRLVSVERA